MTETFAYNTLLLGKNLIQSINDNRKQKCKTWTWHEIAKSLEYIKKLNGDTKAISQHNDITANQVAHVLLKNGKPENKTKIILTSRDKENKRSHIQTDLTKNN